MATNDIEALRRERYLQVLYKDLGRYLSQVRLVPPFVCRALAAADYFVTSLQLGNREARIDLLSLVVPLHLEEIVVPRTDLLKNITWTQQSVTFTCNPDKGWAPNPIYVTAYYTIGPGGTVHYATENRPRWMIVAWWNRELYQTGLEVTAATPRSWITMIQSLGHDRVGAPSLWPKQMLKLTTELQRKNLLIPLEKKKVIAQIKETDGQLVITDNLEHGANAAHTDLLTSVFPKNGVIELVRDDEIMCSMPPARQALLALLPGAFQTLPLLETLLET